jgi:hypothetical protein
MDDNDISIYGFTDKPEKSHAAIRSKERYGLELTNEDLQKMSEICQGNSALRDYQKNLGYSKHHIHVKYKDIWWNLIWCSETNIICTILHQKHNPKSKI